MQHFPPLGQAMKSRIVIFSKQANALQMRESPIDHTVSMELPSEFFLTQFPILEETETSIAFDFNAGMKNIFAADEIRTRDFQGTDHKPHYTALRCKYSSIKEAAMNSRNQLSVHQKFQLDVDMGFIVDHSTIVVKYYLSPYNPNPAFEPVVLAKNLDHFGFFETWPRLIPVTGKTELNAYKIDIKKPFEFAISSNTPADFRQAVRDGILYWNQYFPSKPLRVIDGPEGITAPDVNHNILQWVPWDDLGYARADMQVDPRTGEVLHAQVYVGSGWAFFGKQEARTLYRRMRARNIAEPVSLKEKDSRSAEFTMDAINRVLNGKELPPICDLRANEQPANSYLALLTPESSLEDSIYLQVSQDIIRETVAHEVGHILGLRHNFAGSLTTSHYALKDRELLFKNHLNGKPHPKGIIPTGSVMDYLALQESVWVGNEISKNGIILPYDQMAIQTLYGLKDFDPKNFAPFCTDSEKTKYVDCKPFDAGASATELAKLSVHDRIETLPYEIMEQFIATKDHLKQKFNPAEVNLDPKNLAEEILKARGRILEDFGDVGFVKIQKGLKKKDPTNQKKVSQDALAYFIEEVENLGGMDETFPCLPPQYASQSFGRFRRLLDSGVYSETFTPEETEQILEAVKTFFDEFHFAFTLADLSLWKDSPKQWKVARSKIGRALALFLKKRVEDYLFATQDGKSLNVEIELPVEDDKGKLDYSNRKMINVTLPQFVYTEEVRTASVKLLSTPDFGESLGWGFQERAKLKEQFGQKMKDILGCSIGNIDLNKVDKILPDSDETFRATMLWIWENQKLFRSL